jgi:hypothetical protein
MLHTEHGRATIDIVLSDYLPEKESTPLLMRPTKVALTGLHSQFGFRNYYQCPYDGTMWADEWHCTSNDRCPICDREIEPYFSDDVVPHLKQ